MLNHRQAKKRAKALFDERQREYGSPHWNGKRAGFIRRVRRLAMMIPRSDEKFIDAMMYLDSIALRENFEIDFGQ